ncbi:MAG: sigma-70 family RNA polymerase sigma factor [Planctomycetes bacterium]|nr:sigma-70 family RNA polymerase sigma factor [Planctomycetota bacterium]
MSNLENDSWAQRIESARLGNVEDLGQLLERFRNYLTLLARIQLHRRLFGKVSESDVVQQTFMNACQSFPDFRGLSQEELTAWLRRILSTCLAKQIRRYMETAGRNASLEKQILSEINQSTSRLNASLIAREKSPSTLAFQQEQSLLLADAVERLPSHYRDVIVARYFEDLPFSEIAKRLSRTEDSVQKLWWRGLAKLRQMLQSNEDDI